MGCCLQQGGSLKSWTVWFYLSCTSMVSFCMLMLSYIANSQRGPHRVLLLHPHLIPVTTKQMWNQHFLCLGCRSKFIHTKAISFKFMVGTGLALSPLMPWFEVYLQRVSPFNLKWLLLIKYLLLWLHFKSCDLNHSVPYYFSIWFLFMKLFHPRWFIHIWLEISL